MFAVHQQYVIKTQIQTHSNVTMSPALKCKNALAVLAYRAFAQATLLAPKVIKPLTRDAMVLNAIVLLSVLILTVSKASAHLTQTAIRIRLLEGTNARVPHALMTLSAPL